MANHDINTSRRLEEENALSGGVENLDDQVLPESYPIENNVVKQNLPPTHPTMLQTPIPERSSTTIEQNTPITQAGAILKKQNAMLGRELKPLESYNRPGTYDLLGINKTSRTRIPSLQKARMMYEDQRESIYEELECLYEQNFEDFKETQLPYVDINSRYQQIRSLQEALQVDATKLTKLLTEQGYCEEPRKINEVMQKIQTPIVDIKLRFSDIVSTASTSILEERRADFDEIDIRINRTSEATVQTTSHPPMTQYGIEVSGAGPGERTERYMEQLFHATYDIQSQKLLQGEHSGIASREDQYTPNISEKVYPGRDLVNEQMHSSDTEWIQASYGDNEDLTGNPTNLMSTVVSSTTSQPITSVSDSWIPLPSIDQHDRAANTRNITTQFGCIPSTIAIPSSSVPHTHVVTCNGQFCLTNVPTYTQSHFHTTSTHQPVGGTPGWPHFFHTTSQESQMPTTNVPRPIRTQEVRTSPREKSSVEQQIETLAEFMKEMVRSEIGTIRSDIGGIRTEMQNDIAQGMSLVEARSKRSTVPNTHQSIQQVDRKLTPQYHQPFTASR